MLRCFSQHFDLTILGVKQRPLVVAAFAILMERRNQLLNVDSAPNLFAYLGRLDGLNRQFIDGIKNVPFIPLGPAKNYVKVSQIFIRPSNSNDDGETRGLIDYVDFGSEANAFLLSVGVVAYPTAETLANLLIDRQTTFFGQVKENDNDLVAAKIRVYLNCLKQLAAVTRQLNVEPLRSRLISKPWCLGFQMVERPDGTKERISRIARPADIYLDDDHQCAIDLRPLCAPDEPELTILYETFGSKWLSESVQRTLIHRGELLRLRLPRRSIDRALKSFRAICRDESKPTAEKFHSPSSRHVVRQQEGKSFGSARIRNGIVIVLFASLGRTNRECR